MMALAGHVALIGDAIVDKKTTETLRVLHDCALRFRLSTTADPPLSETCIEHQRLAFEDAGRGWSHGSLAVKLIWRPAGLRKVNRNRSRLLTIVETDPMLKMSQSEW